MQVKRLPASEAGLISTRLYSGALISNTKSGRQCSVITRGVGILNDTRTTEEAHEACINIRRINLRTSVGPVGNKAYIVDGDWEIDGLPRADAAEVDVDVRNSRDGSKAINRKLVRSARSSVEFRKLVVRAVHVPGCIAGDLGGKASAITKVEDRSKVESVVLVHLYTLSQDNLCLVGSLYVEVGEKRWLVDTGTVGHFEIHVGCDTGNPWRDITRLETTVDEQLRVHTIGSRQRERRNCDGRSRVIPRGCGCGGSCVRGDSGIAPKRGIVWGHECRCDEWRSVSRALDGTILSANLGAGIENNTST